MLFRGMLVALKIQESYDAKNTEKLLYLLNIALFCNRHLIGQIFPEPTTQK